MELINIHKWQRIYFVKSTRFTWNLYIHYRYRYARSNLEWIMNNKLKKLVWSVLFSYTKFYSYFWAAQSNVTNYFIIIRIVHSFNDAMIWFF